MATISVSLPTDGTTADVADVNTPIQRIIDEFNGNIDNANIKAGAAIATSKLADDAGITTAKLGAASVTPTKLATGAAAALVTTSETTTSTSYADLATTTDSVTVDIGANGLALVIISCNLQNSGANGLTYMGYAVSGATTVAGTDNRALSLQSYTAGGQATLSFMSLHTGLTAGSNTFKAKYRVAAGTGSFSNRRIAVVPL